MRSALALVMLAGVSSCVAGASATVAVNCDSGLDAPGCGSDSSACRTIAYALPLAGSGKIVVSAPKTGRCELESTLAIPASSSGLSIESSGGMVTLSGGRALSAGDFVPVAKYPEVEAQIVSPAARAAALVAELPVAINATSETYGEQWAHFYVGGNGCLLPGRLAPTGMRFFVGGEWQTNAGFPGPATAVGNITRIVKVLPDRTVVPSDDMQRRMAAWAPQFASPKPDV